MSKKGLIARASALLLLPAAFAATAFTAVGCGDDAKLPDAGIDAPPPAPAALSMTPQTGDFGSVTVGTTSPALSFTVTNTGGSVSGSINAIASGANSSDFNVQTTCSTLTASGTCVVTVTFTPAASGAATANLVVSGSPGGTVMASLNGAGILPGFLSITPSSHAFGDQINATTSTTSSFTVTNTGGVTTGTLTVTPAGSDPNQFVKSADTCNGMTLAAAATCSFSIAFSPTSLGAKSASFDVTASPGGMVSAAVSGNSLSAAHVAINPSVQDFGSVVVLTSSANITFSVGNTGGFATGALTAPVLGGTDAASFTIVNQNCTGLVLMPNLGNSCNIVAKFTPLTPGPKSATLSVTGTPGGTATASLTGAGITGSGITIAPSTKDYGATNTGTASASQVFTVTNDGAVTTAPLTTALSGTNPGEFQVVAGSNGCAGTPLAALASCTVSITFNPTSGGSKTASFVVSNGGNVASASLSGLGVVPTHFTIAPTSKDFGSVTTMTNSAFQSFTITNDGGTTSGAVTVALNGANSTEFNTPSACGPIAPLGTCIVMVRFSPVSIGNKSATLDVTSPGASVSAPLSGIGITPAQINANPSSLTFNDTLEGSTDTTQTFTVTNGGATTTSALMVAVAGVNAADYSASGCTGQTLMNLQSCVVTVTFAPKAGPSGGRVASVVVSAATGGTATVGLSGTTEPAIEIISPTLSPFDFGTVSATCNGVAGIAPPLLAPGDVLDHPGAGAACPQNTITLQNNTATAQTVTVTPAGPGWSGTAPSPYQFVSGVTCLFFGGGQTFDNTKPFTFTMSPPILGIIDQCTITTQFAPTASTLNTQTSTVTFSIGAGGPFNTAVQAYTGVGTNAMLSISPNPFDYANVAVGTTKTQVFTVLNQTGVTTGVLQTLLGAPGTGNAHFHVTQDNCAGTKLANNATCTITIVYIPTAASGAEAATLAVHDSMGGVASAMDNLTANAVSNTTLVVNDPCGGGTCAPGTTGGIFGNTFIGASSPSAVGNFHTYTVTNTGANSGPITIALAGANYTIATGSANDCVSGTTVVGAVAGPGVVTTCNIRVRYLPTGAHLGVTTETATLTVSAAPGGTIVKNLTGNSVSTIHTTANTTTDYGNVVVGATKDLSYAVFNDSQQSVTVSMITTTNPEFTVVNNMCGAAIAPAGNCIYSIRWAPVVGTLGPRSGVQVNVTATNGLGQIGVSAAEAAAEAAAGAPVGLNDTRTLKGNAITRANLAWNPSSFDFGSVLSGSASANGSFTELFTLINNGADALLANNANAVTLANNAMGDYTIVPANGLAFTGSDCTFSPGVGMPTVIQNGLSANGGSCFVAVKFAPVLGHNGTSTANLVANMTQTAVTTATTNNPTYNVTATAALTGVGLANGSVTVSPTAGSFQAAAIGTTSTSCIGTIPNSATCTFTVTNGGGAAANLTNTVPAEFTRDITVANNCGATLNAGGTCNVGVKFTPTTAGAHQGQLVVVPGTYASLYGTGLANTGIGGLNMFNFGVVQVNTPANSGTLSPGTYTITNNNADATGPISLTIGGTDAGLFTIQNNMGAGTCGGVAGVNGTVNLQPGQSCTFTVQFLPTVAAGFGAKMATLTLTSTGGLNVTAPLSGTAANFPQVALTPSALQHDGSRPVGQVDTAPTIYTVSNHVNSFPSGKIAIQLTGADKTDFVLTTTGVAMPCHLTSSPQGAGTDNSGTVLGDGGFCNFGVLFNPSNTLGLKTVTVNVTDPATGELNAQPQTGSLDGTATDFWTTPGCGDVAGTACTTPVALGTGAAPVAIVFTNSASIATDPVVVDQTALGSQVSIISDTCVNTKVAAGGNCTITVRYEPDGGGGPTGAKLSVSATVTTTTPMYGRTGTSAPELAFVTFTP